MIKAVLFSTPTCPWCPRTGRYLVDKGVKVREIDVERPEGGDGDGAQERSDGRASHRIGESWIVGFNRSAID